MNAEKEALKLVRRSERRYRWFLYFLAILVVAFAVFQIILTRRDISSLISELDKTNKNILEDNQDKLDLIICMLLIPPDQRTQDTPKNCQQQVDQLRSQQEPAEVVATAPSAPIQSPPAQNTNETATSPAPPGDTSQAGGAGQGDQPAPEEPEPPEPPPPSLTEQVVEFFEDIGEAAMNTLGF